MSEYIERRKYERINVNIPIKYREIISDDIITREILLCNSRCINISRGGMRILTAEKWSGNEDRLVEAEFVMSGRVIRLIARVVWESFDSSTGMNRSGIEFIVIKSGDLEVIGQIA